MTRAIVFVTALLLAIYLFATFLRRNGMFFPDVYPAGRWELDQWPVTPTDHYFTTSDNVKLHAWLFRAQNANAPMIVWCHGNAGNLTDRAEMASELAKRGVSVFVFDWRGYGRSEGKARESALLLDALAAHDYAKQSLGAKSIVMYGESIGGPYAAYVAKERKDVRVVIIENSFPSLKDLGNALYFRPLGYFAPRALRTTDWLNESNAKVLVMHGTRDQVIPYALGKKLFEELRVEKSMLTSHAGHCEIPLFEPERYYEAVTRFVQ